METRLTITKIKNTLQHDYVEHLANRLVLRVDKKTHSDIVILQRPFEPKIANIEADYNEDCTLKGDPSVRIGAAHYTTRENVAEVIKDLKQSSPN